MGNRSRNTISKGTVRKIGLSAFCKSVADNTSASTSTSQQMPRLLSEVRILANAGDRSKSNGVGSRLRGILVFGREECPPGQRNGVRFSRNHQRKRRDPVTRAKSSGTRKKSRAIVMALSDGSSSDNVEALCYVMDLYSETI